MRAVSRKKAAVALAKMLSKEHGPMVLVRLSCKTPTKWETNCSGDLDPSEFATWVRFAVLPEHSYQLVTESDRPRTALLSVAIFDAPIQGDRRYAFLKKGSFSEAGHYVNGEERYQWSDRNDGGYDVFDRLNQSTSPVGFIGGAA